MKELVVYARPGTSLSIYVTVDVSAVPNRPDGNLTGWLKYEGIDPTRDAADPARVVANDTVDMRNAQGNAATHLRLCGIMQLKSGINYTISATYDHNYNVNGTIKAKAVIVSSP